VALHIAMLLILALQLLSVGQCVRPEQLSRADDHLQVMLQVNGSQEMSMSQERRAEVVQLIHEVSDCAGQATAFVYHWGKAWTKFIELLLPQTSMLSQFIDLLTPVLKNGRVEALAAIGCADSTTPNCASTSSLQQASPSILLETTNALSDGMCKQAGEVREILEAIKGTAQQLQDIVSVPTVFQSLLSKQFLDFTQGSYLQTIENFLQDLPQCTAAAEDGSLLQVEGTAEAMAQSLRLTANTCTGEASAFLQYGQDMVQHCTTIREGTTLLESWTGLEEASQHCIDVFSDYTENSEMHLCA